MSAEADIYPNKNFGFRPKSRPVVAFGVKFKIFNLFGGLGGRVPRVGVRCVETARLFWLLFWSQKSNALPEMPFSRRRCRPPGARSHPPHTHHPKIFLIHPKIFLIYKKFAHCPGKTLVL